MQSSKAFFDVFELSRPYQLLEIAEHEVTLEFHPTFTILREGRKSEKPLDTMERFDYMLDQSFALFSWCRDEFDFVYHVLTPRQL